MKTKIFAMICALTMLACIFVGCASDLKSSPDTSKSQTEEITTPPEEPSATTYVSLDINPEISLTVDGENLVTGIFAENEDAQVLLYGEEDLIGADLEAVVEKITSLAVELGYIDEENKVVGVMVSSENEEAVTEIQSKIEEKVKKIAEDKKIEITTSKEGSFSLVCDLEDLKEQYPDNEKIQSLTLEKFKLAKTAFEAGEMTVEEAVELEEKDLINRVNKAFNRIDKFATKSYGEAKKNAEVVYEAAVNALADSLYNDYYMANAEKYSDTFYYGFLYQLYSSSYRTYLTLAEKLLQSEEIANTELTEEQANEIADALDLENIEDLANSDGQITLDSIENFLDKQVKNSKDPGKLDRVKDQVKDKFNKIEKEVTDKIDKEKQESNKIDEALEEQIELFVTAMNMVLSEESKAELEAYVNEYKNIIAVSYDGLTKEEAQEIADALKVKADEILAKIESDLNEEDLKAIEEQKAQIENRLTEEKQKCEDAINQAKEDAKSYLENAKNERRQGRK